MECFHNNFIHTSLSDTLYDSAYEDADNMSYCTTHPKCLKEKSNKVYKITRSKIMEFLK